MITNAKIWAVVLLLQILTFETCVKNTCYVLSITYALQTKSCMKSQMLWLFMNTNSCLHGINLIKVLDSINSIYLLSILTQPASTETIKLYWNSLLSTPWAKYCIVNKSNMYLMSLFPFVGFWYNLIPQFIIEYYKLNIL